MPPRAARTPEARPETGPTGRPRPQQLLLALLGEMVLDRHPEPLPSRVFLDVLGRLGVTDVAARATLNRMTHRGLLTRGRQGREAVYEISAAGRRVLRHGAGRIFSPEPFGRADGEWTLLSFTLPETHRDLRHQVRSRLAWAGFGPVRDGLWIAPGTVDPLEILGGLDLAEAAEASFGAFAGRPLPPTRLDLLVRRAWNLVEIRAAHEEFLGRWAGAAPEPGGALPALAALLADWIRLLRTDPGLPATYLAEDWPAARSARSFQRLHTCLAGPARAGFEALIRGA
ncbi:PaaX family transcriptional regulator [Actinomadura scrupuli]|uniref:PaaX family transcriptional regulator n=1 Tax=Actinomadura scrupuli TaxID=559629 RepID=UPI003D95F502